MSTRHVLIVDDLHDIRQLLRSSLESLKLDMKVIDVPSGEEAMLVIARQKYDLLVSDVRLAGISGLDLVRRVRKGNPDLKVILVTGMVDSEVRQQVAEFGANAYFFKPIDLVEFQKCVAGFLGFEAPSLPEPPATPPQAHTIGKSLPERLARLQLDLQAACVWVADAEGKIVLQVGEFPEGWSSAGLKPLLSAASSASLEVSRALKREFPENYLYLSGPELNLHAVSLGWSYTLLAVTPQRVESGLLVSSSDILASLAEYLASAMQTEPSQADEPVEVIDTGQLVEVIQHAQEKRLNLQEIDDYWEAAADQQDKKESGESGSLSYEQARKLGLAPEE